MHENNYKIGDMANGHILTDQGWLPLGAPEPATAPVPPKRKKGRKVLAISATALTGLFLVSALAGGTDTGSAAEPTEKPSASASTKPADKPEGTTDAADSDAAPKVTLAQQNALRAAEAYLATMPFSKAGLIDQLSSQYGSDFNLADAKWAVEQLDVDWKEQAVLAGQSYLDTMPFSRQGLIEQLSSQHGSQFTVAQATYAVDQLGL